MRIIVMFDLPVKTLADKRNYRYFRKVLISQGFLMLQKSVYCKMVINLSKVQSVIRKLKAVLPDKGVVQILVITEKQFAGMETVTGDMNQSIIGGDEGIIII